MLMSKTIRRLIHSKLACCAVLLFMWSGPAVATPITVLEVNSTQISLGQAFEVVVKVDNDISTEQLLAFGFDVAPISPLLEYQGYTMGNAFMDVSFGMNNISGAAFPGLSSSDIVLATLMFKAVDIGLAEISISGLFDNAFYGLFYEISGFDIIARNTVTIGMPPINASAPLSGLMFLFALLLICFKAQRK